MSALGLCSGCRVTGWWPPHIPTSLLMMATIYLSFAYENHSDGISDYLIACHIFLPLPVSSFFQIPAPGVRPLTEELNIRTLHCNWIFLILLQNIMSVFLPTLFFIPFPLEDAWSHSEIFTHFSLWNLQISGRPAYMQREHTAFWEHSVACTPGWLLSGTGVSSNDWIWFYF